MQSSIEWLEEQLTYQLNGETLNKFYDWKDITDIYNQAKLLHKQEIIDAYMDRMDVTNKEVLANIIGEEYYQKTFGKG
jgi:hypothetical protein